VMTPGRYDERVSNVTQARSDVLVIGAMALIRPVWKVIDLMDFDVDYVELFSSKVRGDDTNSYPPP